MQLGKEPFPIVSLTMLARFVAAWACILPGVSWEEHKDAAQMCRDGIRKAKVQLELHLSRNVKNGKMGFYRYVAQKSSKYPFQ